VADQAKPGRRPLHRREEIVRAAVEVFREKGYERATVRDIAARVGITTSSLYSHIASKQELFLEAVQPVIEAGAARMARIAASEAAPAEKVREAIVGAVAAFAEHYPEVSIYVREFYPLLETAEPEVRRRYERAWEEIVRSGIESGAFRGDADARVVVYGILGMVNWMHRWYRPDGARTVEEIGGELARLVLGGLEA
jgi:TetR/AcrR family transcriptional regulator, cholesterol catabolism regulator